MTNRHIPKYIYNILKRINNSGFESYLVGGCVRDMLIRRRIHDWDIATSASPEEVIRIFPKTLPTGIKFGTVTVLSGGGKAEVTTFRSEGIYNDGRRPENVSFVSSLPVDLSRRDFTVNAMAMDIDGRITDPYGGIDDLSSKTIRCVGNAETRFSEDALRMFRAVRFSAQLGFEIEGSTKDAIIKLGYLAKRLSAERILSETEKILLSPHPEYLHEAFEYGLYSFLTEKIPDKNKLSKIKTLPRDKDIRLAAFAYIAEGSSSEFLRSLHASAASFRMYGNIDRISCESDADIKFSLIKHESCAVICACGTKDILYGGTRLKKAKGILKSNSVPSLSITGSDLIVSGITEGKKLGEVLSLLTRHICQYPEDNTPKKLLALAEKSCFANEKST